MSQEFISILGRIGFIVVLGVLLFAIGIRLFETRMVYFPYKYPNGFWQPSYFGVTVEDCYFYAEDKLKLHAWFAPSKGAKFTLLNCHGNGGNLTYCTDQIRLFQRELNLNVFAFDYRGYGRSEGAPSEEGLYRDADAAYDYLLNVKKISPEQLILYGQSLGGAVAVDLAARKKCAGLIVESSFSSARDVARGILLFKPAVWIMKSKFDSAEKIRKVHCPVLVMHGSMDRTIPMKLGKRVFEAANEPKFFYEIPGAGHNDVCFVGGEPYLRILREFISKL